jgi:hypothetical protein
VAHTEEQHVVGMVGAEVVENGVRPLDLRRDVLVDQL